MKSSHKTKKEIERPLIYFVGQEVKTLSIFPNTNPPLVLYGYFPIF